MEFSVKKYIISYMHAKDHQAPNFQIVQFVVHTLNIFRFRFEDKNPFTEHLAKPIIEDENIGD